MKGAKLNTIYAVALAFLGLFSCKNKETELAWSESYFQIGSQSSIRTADLNGDQVLDLVMGAGRDETVATDHGVLAINGINGQLLWKQKGPAHVVGSASFQDINDDGTDDVFIGGRGSFFTALDGKTGDEIWQYQWDFEDHPVLRYARFNFYNSVWIPDQNGDGKQELLTVNGGNWGARAGYEDGRLPGVLMVFDSKTGEIIAADSMPDAKESYMSPVSYQDPKDNQRKIVFGTGGETIGGSLYVCNLSDLANGQLTQATKLATEDQHGFIAPPVLADLNKDGVVDIIAISHASTILAFDGHTHEELWRQSFQGVESSTSFAVGHFTNRENIEILAVMDRGTWPKYSFANQVVLDGPSGSIVYHDSVGCFVVSSPVAYDLDNDGLDEAILNVNDYQCDLEMKEDLLDPPGISHQLVAIDFKDKTHQVIDQTRGFRNIFSTPWIGDLDNDGYLDIVYNLFNHSHDLRRFLGMNVKRISTHIKTKQPVIWGAYMGSNGDGIYDRNE